MLIVSLFIFFGQVSEAVASNPASGTQIKRELTRVTRSLDRSATLPSVQTAAVTTLGRWLHGDRALGGWLGGRARMEGRGVTVEGSHVLDWSAPLSGGERTRDVARGLFDLSMALDLETLVGVPGATIFAEGYFQWGREGSPDVGDFQGFSNIDSEDRTQLAELWFQQELMGDKLRLKVGKFDANSEFAFVDTAGDFINSSAGFSPTIFVMPTYPDPATGVLVFLYPSSSFYTGVGFFDGDAAEDVPTGKRGARLFAGEARHFFVIGESGLIWERGLLGRPGRLAVGFWHHTGDFDRFDGGTDHGATGAFALIEQELWSASNGEFGRISGFLQYGWADEDVSEAGQHLGVGLSWQGWLPCRSDDATGLMVSWVDLSDEPGAGLSRNETVVEVYHRIALTPFAIVKPDLQIVLDPSGDRRANTAVVGTLRFEVAF